MSHTDVSPKEARAQLKRLLVAREQRPQPKPGGWAVAIVSFVAFGLSVVAAAVVGHARGWW